MPIQPLHYTVTEVQGEQGKYKLQDLLSGGGYMAHVYLGQDLASQRKVAIKSLRPPPSDAFAYEYENWKKARDYFQREIKVMGNIHDDGVVQILDQGFTEEIPWFVMEYISGPELTLGLQNSLLYHKVCIFRQLLEIIARLHSQGIFHRDLKPPNILLRNGNQPVVLDFGIAKVVDLAWQSMSLSYNEQGTPRYMAPEQAEGQQENEKWWAARIDVWALGVLLYEVLTAQYPFLPHSDNNTSPWQYQQAIKNNAYISLRERDEIYDPVLDTICERALARNSQERYNSAQEFFTALNEWEAANCNIQITTAASYRAQKNYVQAEQVLLKAMEWEQMAKGDFNYWSQEICAKIEALLTERYQREIVLQRVPAISPLIWQVWQLTQRKELPACFSGIYHLHENPPYVGVLRPQRITRQPDDDRALITTEQAMLLVRTIQAAEKFCQSQGWSLPRLERDHLHLVMSQGTCTAIQLWGLGWRAEETRDLFTALYELLKELLCDSEGSIGGKLGDLIYEQKPRDYDQIITALEDCSPPYICPY